LMSVAGEHRHECLCYEGEGRVTESPYFRGLA
jgi:hypothetical protein